MCSSSDILLGRWGEAERPERGGWSVTGQHPLLAHHPRWPLGCTLDGPSCVLSEFSTFKGTLEKMCQKLFYKQDHLFRISLSLGWLFVQQHSSSKDLVVFLFILFQFPVSTVASIVLCSEKFCGCNSRIYYTIFLPPCFCISLHLMIAQQVTWVYEVLLGHHFLCFFPEPFGPVERIYRPTLWVGPLFLEISVCSEIF